MRGMKTQAMFQPCPICGRIMNPRAKTCGLCAGKGRKKEPAKLVTEKCRNCGEEFQIPLWRHNQNRGVFCSRECKDNFQKTIRGAAHHKFVSGPTQERYIGTSWKQARQAVIERAGGKCEWCGEELLPRRYAIHHIIGSDKFETPEDSHNPDNLSAICKSCHAKFHRLGKMPECKGGDG